MANYSSVYCCEEHGSRQEVINDEGANCSVVLRCNWADRFLLTNDIIGKRLAWPSLTAVPRPPRARSATIVPVDGTYNADAQEIVYVQALVTVEYDNKIEEPEDPSSSDQSELIITETIEPSTEFLTLDYRKFRWDNAAGDPLTEAEAPGRPMHRLNLVRQMVKWEPPLPIELLSLINCVNDADYVSNRLNLTFAAKTLLYVPAPMTHSVTTKGSEAWNVTLKFAYNPDGWDVFWRASKNLSQQIWSVDAADFYIHFPPEDFSSLLF